MKIWKLSFAVLSLSLLASVSRAEDAKPDAPKPAEVTPAEIKPADAAKPADATPAATDTKTADAKPAETKIADTATATDKAKSTTDGELPKAPEGTSPINATHENESLIGDLSKGAGGEGKKAAKKAAKKGLNPDALVLHVAGQKNKADKGDKDAKKEAKHGKDITLTASGDILAQLTAFAEKHAHIKVTGSLSGDTMTVKEVSEAPADAAGKKKKKDKNNA